MRYIVGTFGAFAHKNTPSSIHITDTYRDICSISMDFKSMRVFLNPNCIILKNENGSFIINNIDSFEVYKNEAAHIVVEVFCNKNGEASRDYVMIFI